MPNSLAAQLERDGVVLLPDLISAETLADMQAAFKARLKHLRWNDSDGYEKTEPHRHMVQDVLTLAQGFVDLALHPLVKQTLRDYIGESFELVEAKGWRSLPTRRDFHGWHGDAWYDQKVVNFIPREVKLAVYLTDVTSGAFNYIRGSHGQQAPRPVRNHEVDLSDPSAVVEMTGRAGTAFLFDTSGIHRQSVPILENRHAVFYNYHDPSVPLQKEDVDYYRYHPLILNAAFLGDLDAEDRRILGFGNKTNYLPAFERQAKDGGLRGIASLALNSKLHTQDFQDRIVARLKSMLGRTRAQRHVEPAREVVKTS